MASARLEIEKFNGKNDFSFWRVKMNAFLVHGGLDTALVPKPTDMTAAENRKWEEIQKKAHFAIILCLAESVIREGIHEKNAINVWTKWEALYM